MSARYCDEDQVSALVPRRHEGALITMRLFIPKGRHRLCTSRGPTRQIALSHGGQLELRANQPEGSVFTLILPGTIESQSS